MIKIEKEKSYVIFTPVSDSGITYPIELDRNAVPSLQEAFLEAEKEKILCFILNAEHITFIDVAILRCLIQEERALKKKGGQFILLSPQLAIQHLLKIARLTESLCVASSIEEARELSQLSSHG